MIDAWIHGKIRRSDSVYEDEVVSATIGHLQYFPNKLRARIFKRLLNKGFVKLSDDFINANSSKCIIELWPNIATEGRVEPDVIVTMTPDGAQDGARQVVIVIEAKWNSGQGQGQLTEQWKSAKGKYKGSQIYHLFLTRSYQYREEMLGSGTHGELTEKQDHAESLASVTWSQFVQCIEEEAQTTKKTRTANESGFRLWSENISRLFSMIGSAPFQGFTGVKKNRPVNANARWYFRSRLIRPPICGCRPGPKFFSYHEGNSK